MAKKRVRPPLSMYPLELAAADNAGLATLAKSPGSNQPANIPCRRCEGTGREKTAIEQWPQIRNSLLNFGWIQKRIDECFATLKTNEMLGALFVRSVRFDKADGSSRTFFYDDVKFRRDE